MSGFAQMRLLSNSYPILGVISPAKILRQRDSPSRWIRYQIRLPIGDRNLRFYGDREVEASLFTRNSMGF